MGLVALATIVSALPSVKNQMNYGILSASTWVGLNLAQTIPGGQTGELVKCDFDNAWRDGAAAHPGSLGDPRLLTQIEKRAGTPNMHHAGMIATSRQCLEMTRQIILRDPLAWLSFRMATLSGTHQLSPSNYDADPLGWDAVFGSFEAVLGFDIAARTAMTLWYLLLIAFAVKCIPSNPPLYLSLLGVIVYFTLASHLFNGSEQSRMRYTIEPLYLFLCAGLRR